MEILNVGPVIFLNMACHSSHSPPFPFLLLPVWCSWAPVSAPSSGAAKIPPSLGSPPAPPPAHYLCRLLAVTVASEVWWPKLACKKPLHPCDRVRTNMSNLDRGANFKLFFSFPKSFRSRFITEGTTTVPPTLDMCHGRPDTAARSLGRSVGQPASRSDFRSLGRSLGRSTDQTDGETAPSGRRKVFKSEPRPVQSLSLSLAGFCSIKLSLKEIDD